MYIAVYSTYKITRDIEREREKECACVYKMTERGRESSGYITLHITVSTIVNFYFKTAVKLTN